MPIYNINGKEFDLFPSEASMVFFVNKIGLDRARKLSLMVNNRMKRRSDLYNSERVYFDYVFTPIGVAKPWELELRHTLSFGICVLDDYNTPYNAHKRILKRIQARKEAAKQKKAAA